MSESKYNFGGMIPALRSEGTDGGQLTVGEFQGFISLTVFVNNKVAIRIPINRHAHFAIKQSFVAIQKAAPGTRLVALNSNEYDPQTRKQNFKNSVIFGKTEEGQYFIEVKDKNSSPLKFLFKWPMTITYGSDPIDDATKSLQAFAVWKEAWERDVPAMMFHSRLNYVPQQRGGNNNRGGGGGRPKQASGGSESEEDEVY